MKAFINLVAFSIQGQVAVLDCPDYDEIGTMAALEKVYHQTQNLTGDGWLVEAERAGIISNVKEEAVSVIEGHRSFRSLSVDDVVVMNEDDNWLYFRVGMIGFEEMSAAELAEHIQDQVVYQEERKNRKSNKCK